MLCVTETRRKGTVTGLSRGEGCAVIQTACESAAAVADKRHSFRPRLNMRFLYLPFSFPYPRATPEAPFHLFLLYSLFLFHSGRFFPSFHVMTSLFVLHERERQKETIKIARTFIIDGGHRVPPWTSQED